MRGDATDPGTQLREAGWCQGSVVDKDRLEALGRAEVDCAVVISQDCDVVQGVDVESYVEVIAARLVEQARPDLLHGRNPRTIDLPAASPTGRHLRASIHDRFRIEKQILAADVPSTRIRLDRGTTSQLAKWIAKRYTRVAWPDTFNERLATIDDKLERLFKSDNGKVITGIWLMLDPADDELAEDREYRLAVWLTMTSDSMMDTKEIRRGEDFEGRLKELLESCKGIELCEIELRKESDVSLEDLRHFRRFDKDYRSIAATPRGALPPEGSDNE
jgi:hypothetical protein